MTRAATVERIVAEYQQASSEIPRHREILLSGDRAGFGERSWVSDERKGSIHLLNRPVEVNYSELVLSAYQRLQDLYKHERRSDQEIAQCKQQIEELQTLEAEQVESLLRSRLSLPLGEEVRLQQATDALLSKYGHLTGDD